MAEFMRGMRYAIRVETNKQTHDFTGTSFHRLRGDLKELEIEGFAPAPGRSRHASALGVSALQQRRAALRVPAWQAFDALWREVRSNFGDFEDDYREWKGSGGLHDDVDAVERAAFVLYDALRADTIACLSEDELSYLDRFTGPKLRHVALQWFREDRASREVPRD